MSEVITSLSTFVVVTIYLLGLLVKCKLETSQMKVLIPAAGIGTRLGLHAYAMPETLLLIDEMACVIDAIIRDAVIKPCADVQKVP